MTEHNPVGISSKSESVCRICLNSSLVEANDIINACKCSGSVGQVHIKCLEKWISTRCKHHCEICLSNYNLNSRLKYGVLSSIPRYLWSRKDYYFMLSCYIKVCIYTYVVFMLLIEFTAMSKPNQNESQTFPVLFTFCLLIVLLLTLYCFLRHLTSWYQWRQCQLDLTVNDNTARQTVQQNTEEL